MGIAHLFARSCILVGTISLPLAAISVLRRRALRACRIAIGRAMVAQEQPQPEYSMFFV